MISFSRYLAEQKLTIGNLKRMIGARPSMAVTRPFQGGEIKTPGAPTGLQSYRREARPEVSVPGFIPGTRRTTTLKPRETPEQGKRRLDTGKAKSVTALGLGAFETARTAEKIHQDTADYVQSMFPGVELSRGDTARIVAAGGVPPVDVMVTSSDTVPNIASGIVKGITTAAAPMSTVASRDQLGTATADVAKRVMTATDPYGERKILADPRGAEYFQRIEKELIRRAQPKYKKLKAGSGDWN